MSDTEVLKQFIEDILEDGTDYDDMREELIGRVERLGRFRSAIIGWRENDHPEGFSRWTAEIMCMYGLQAESEK